MFRQLTALLLVAAFAAQTFSQAVIVLDYYTNTASFARDCVNKALPKMHCNGKCQMMKKLKEEEKKNDQNPERRGENKFQTLSSKSFYTTGGTPCTPVLPAHLAHAFGDRPVGRARAIFHPPATA